MHKKQYRSIFFPNDVPMNIVGPRLGKIGIVPPEIREANINQAIVMMRTIDYYDPRLLMYCLLSPFYYNFMIKMSKGVRQSNIRKSDVGRIPIPLIPLQEQTRLVYKISELFLFVDKIEKAGEQAIKKIDKTESIIFAKLFRGQLVPQDPNDEPASHILERITAEKEKVARNQRLEKLSMYESNAKQITSDEI